jgi:hypothetical protein
MRTFDSYSRARVPVRLFAIGLSSSAKEFTSQEGAVILSLHASKARRNYAITRSAITKKD